MNTIELPGKFSNLRKHFEATHPFSDEEFNQLTSYLHIKVLKKKEFFNLQGHHCRYASYVNTGCLRAYHVCEKEDDFTVYFAFADSWSGDKTSFYSNQPSLFSIQALEDSELFYADKKSWEEAMDKIPVFESWYRASARKTIEEGQRKLIEWQTKSAEEKYLKLLEEAPAIVQRIPQHYIASFLGIKPQSLSRIRKQYSLSPVIY